MMPVPAYSGVSRERTVTASPDFAACRAMAAQWATGHSMSGHAMASRAWIEVNGTCSAKRSDAAAGTCEVALGHR